MDNFNPYDDQVYGWPPTVQRETITQRAPNARRSPDQAVMPPPRQPRPATINKSQRMSKYQAQSLVQKLKRITLAMSLAAFGVTGALIATHMPASATTSSNTNSGTQNTQSGSSNGNSTGSGSSNSNSTGGNTNNTNNGTGSDNSTGSNSNNGGQSQSGNNTSNNGGFFNQGGGGYSFGNGGSTQSPHTRSSVS